MAERSEGAGISGGAHVKVSEFWREYHLTGAVPDERNFAAEAEKDAMLAFWSGWLIGRARSSQSVTNMNEARELAIKAAEFIEEHAR